MTRPKVLTIAGFDPSSGAGVTADIKTMEQHSVYGFAAVTAITFQNDEMFEAVNWLPVDDIIHQVKVLLKKESFQWVKIGLVENFQVLHVILQFLHENISGVKIIWDPILKASAGFNFHSNIPEEVLKELLSKLYLITPNLPEAEKLFNCNPLELQASLIGTSVLLKGGHGEGCYITDLLFLNSGEVHDFHGERFVNNAKHGTGCVLSSAILSNLALGKDLTSSCLDAKLYVETLMLSNESLLGYHSYSGK